MEKRTRFGLRDGEIVHITELDTSERGLKCQCVCPKCHGDLIAKMGKVQTWHFAHAHNEDCFGSDETALHLLAKKILVEEKVLKIPNLSIGVFLDPKVGYCLFDEWKSNQQVLKSYYINFKHDRCEYNHGPYYLDYAGVVNGQLFAIEIYITHEVDEEKIDYLRATGIPCVEIDLGWAYHYPDEYSYKKFKKALIEGLEYKIWLSKPRLWLKNFKAKTLKSYYDQRAKYIAAEKKRIERQEQEEIDRKIRAHQEKKRLKKKKNEIMKHLDPVWRNKRMPEWTKEFYQSPRIRGMLTNMSISIDKLPSFLCYDLENAYAFTCDPRYFQTLLFYTWVFKRQPSEYKVEAIVKWLQDMGKSILAKPLVYPYDVMGECVALDRAVHEYLTKLVEEGFLKNTTRPSWSGKLPIKFHHWFSSDTERSSKMSETVAARRVKFKISNPMDKPGPLIPFTEVNAIPNEPIEKHDSRWFIQNQTKEPEEPANTISLKVGKKSYTVVPNSDAHIQALKEQVEHHRREEAKKEIQRMVNQEKESASMDQLPHLLNCLQVCHISYHDAKALAKLIRCFPEKIGFDPLPGHFDLIKMIDRTLGKTENVPIRQILVGLQVDIEKFRMYHSL